MLFNDISNKTAPIIAFNADNLLFTNNVKKERGFFKKLVSIETEKDKFFNRELNKDNYHIINNLWYRHDYSIYLMTKTNFQMELEEYFSSISLDYTRMFNFIGVDHLRRLVDHRFTYYIDNDIDIISQIGRKNAFLINDIHKYLG